MKSVKSLKGIGTARAKFFENKGINTVSDLLFFFPRDYEDRTKTLLIEDLYEDAKVCVSVRIFSPVKEARIRKNMSIYSLKVTDESGVMSIIWYNNRFVKSQFKTGEEYIFFGKVTRNKGMWEMTNPIFEKKDKGISEGKIMPVYSINEDITQKAVQSATYQAIEQACFLKDYIPESIRKENSLIDLENAIKSMHYPKSFEDLKKAQERFAFEELYLLELALFRRKKDGKSTKKEPFSDVDCRKDFINTLPFALTKAQERVVDEIAEDFKKENAMMRLCQGDVGSGKTAVSAVAIYMAYKNGYQSSIMVPTEILANQHYGTFLKFFENTPIKIEILTSSTKNKKEVLEKIKTGEIDLVIGTHAIIQKGVEFSNLGLVIADEQHRFGVSQRAELSKKGENPHFLVMSATPIPRTLALILYGDLDISVIDELPPDRKEVKTYAVGENMKKRVEDFIRKNINEGSQCYVVCPLVEESEKMDLKNATDLALYYELIFPEFTVGLIHGRMKPAEKDRVMSDFVDKKIDILVSTTVIEVGVNVPSSNIMVIQNAERFGLSQLHQLRGRVGRGSEQAYCILSYQNLSSVTKKRLEVMCKSNDGFLISQEDLKLRGPGDFFGTRQHGLPDLKVANLFSDMMILKKAQSSAEKTLLEDYEITDEEWELLNDKLEKIIPKDVIIN